MNTLDTIPTTFRIGGELEVSRLGYGAMRLTGQPSNFGPYPDWEGGKALLRRAVELGVDFLRHRASVRARPQRADSR